MKRKIWVTAGIAAALAFLIAFGAVGCVVSGFDLPLDDYAGVVLICAAASVFCAAAFSLKWGGAAVLCAFTLLAGYVWRREEAAEQLFGLLYRMTSIYGNAYGWNPLPLSDGATTVDIPMAALGVLLSAAVTWSVCRKLGAFLPVLASLIPLSACMVVTDTVPDVPYLFCLLFGLVILILTGRVRRQSAPQGNRLTAMAAIPTALALAALFLAFPQESYVNRSEATRDAILSWFQSIPEKVENVRQEVTVSSQEPDHVRLASLGRRIESPVTVMEVTAEIGGTLYLRGQDYDGYDGMTWTTSRHRTEDFSLTGVELRRRVHPHRRRAGITVPALLSRPEHGAHRRKHEQHLGIHRIRHPPRRTAGRLAGDGNFRVGDSAQCSIPLSCPPGHDPHPGGSPSDGHSGRRFLHRGEGREDRRLRPRFRPVRPESFPDGRGGDGFRSVVSGKRRSGLLRPLRHGGDGAAPGGGDRSPLRQRLSGENRPRHTRRRHREKRPRLGGIL